MVLQVWHSGSPGSTFFLNSAEIYDTAVKASVAVLLQWTIDNHNCSAMLSFVDVGENKSCNSSILYRHNNCIFHAGTPKQIFFHIAYHFHKMKNLTTFYEIQIHMKI